jgi:hypothetical protein
MSSFGVSDTSSGGTSGGARRAVRGGAPEPPLAPRFVHRNINRATTFTLILIDDCARFVTGHGVDDAERADLVIHTFEEAAHLSLLCFRSDPENSARGVLGMDDIVPDRQAS